MTEMRGRKISFNLKKRPASPPSLVFSPEIESSLGWLGQHFENQGMVPEIKKPIRKKKSTKSLSPTRCSPSSEHEAAIVSKRPLKVEAPLNGKSVETAAMKRKARVAKLKEEELHDISMKSINITLSKVSDPHPDVNSGSMKEHCEVDFILEAIAERADPNTSQGSAMSQRVIKKLSVIERITYVANFLFSLPISWVLANPLSDLSSLHSIEAKAYSGGYTSTKDFIGDIMELIKAERSLITSETPFSVERLIAFKSIRSILKTIQEYFHSYGLLPLSTFTTKPKCLVTALDYSPTSTCYYMKIADAAAMSIARVDGVMNINMFHAFHLPVFYLAAKFKEEHRWDISQAPLIRLTIKNNRTKLSMCGEDNSSACLVEVKTKDSKFLVVKPIGKSYAILDKECTDIDSPKAWIWAAVIGIFPNSAQLTLNLQCLHSPKSFEKKPNKLQASIRQVLDNFFGK
ncbi:hypothetical protein DSO57_1005793 [Entomophthora muscae]|uniref:Uncharacterized protein n=1 Tax=Entomophthora muscae TaxID=34485 RepID=A0ACC2SXB2_9FUNG|nr:hypothetical protein DSO57_1005793 [Entomophthora muscae]